MEAEFMDHAPGPDDVARILLLDLSSRATPQVVAQTRAWNWQMSCRLCAACLLFPLCLDTVIAIKTQLPAVARERVAASPEEGHFIGRYPCLFTNTSAPNAANVWKR